MMRLPEFLEDRKVFLDEPLVSMFAMRRQRSVRRIETGWTELFADAVEKAPNGVSSSTSFKHGTLREPFIPFDSLRL